MLPGNTGEQADAPMAYTQCELGAGTEGPTTQTWVELPEHMRPAEWIKKGYHRPIVPLIAPGPWAAGGEGSRESLEEVLEHSDRV